MSALGIRTSKIISVNISGVYEVICMKLCNLIPIGVKSHLKGRKTLLIAPKQGLWAKKSKISNVNISGVYEAICTKFCSLISPNPKYSIEGGVGGNFHIALKMGSWGRNLKNYKCQSLVFMKLFA